MFVLVGTFGEAMFVLVGTFRIVAYTSQPSNVDTESTAALITELLRSRVCNPLARSAGVFLRNFKEF